MSVSNYPTGIRYAKVNGDGTLESKIDLSVRSSEITNALAGAAVGTGSYSLKMEGGAITETGHGFGDWTITASGAGVTDAAGLTSFTFSEDGLYLVEGSAEFGPNGGVWLFDETRLTIVSDGPTVLQQSDISHGLVTFASSPISFSSRFTSGDQLFFDWNINSAAGTIAQVGSGRLKISKLGV